MGTVAAPSPLVSPPIESSLIEVKRIFSTQSRLFLDFRYSSEIENVNVTEFAFAYAGSGAFVS